MKLLVWRSYSAALFDLGLSGLAIMIPFEQGSLVMLTSASLLGGILLGRTFLGLTPQVRALRRDPRFRQVRRETRAWIL
jgi:hypothetical protein